MGGEVESPEVVQRPHQSKALSQRAKCVLRSRLKNPTYRNSPTARKSITAASAYGDSEPQNGARPGGKGPTHSTHDMLRQDGGSCVVRIHLLVQPGYSHQRRAGQLPNENG